MSVVAIAAPATQAPANVGAKSQKIMPILDKDQQLARWNWRDNLDNDWFKTNIPFFESPDEEIDKTYYYRWELVTKHMVYGSPADGYSFTEFIKAQPWSGKYGPISCPLGLQLYELRWLKDRNISEDYARYWFGVNGAQPRSYSNWYGDALWANYLVSNDKPFITGLLPSMEKQYQGWLDEHWNADHQMFAWSGMHDGMEFTIGSRQTKDEFGGRAFLPSHAQFLRLRRFESDGQNRDACWATRQGGGVRGQSRRFKKSACRTNCGIQNANFSYRNSPTTKRKMATSLKPIR